MDDTLGDKIGMSLPLWKEDFMKKVEEDAKNNDMTIPHPFAKKIRNRHTK